MPPRKPSTPPQRSTPSRAGVKQPVPALSRLCLVVAIATLYLVAQGSEVVKQGQRGLVAPHWLRGSSYLKMSWNWVKLALTRGYALITHMSVSGECDPELAMASKCYAPLCRQGRFAFALSEAA
jgi:hypothetical protein